MKSPRKKIAEKNKKQKLKLGEKTPGPAAYFL